MSFGSIHDGLTAADVDADFDGDDEWLLVGRELQ